jgi:hypothetical protein
MTGRRCAVAVVSLTLLAGACEATVDVGADTPGPWTSPQSSSTPPSRTWLAALRVARDPDTLDAETAELRDVLGRSLVISPASCFVGLPPSVPGSGYVLGVVAADRAALDDVVDRLDRHALFEAEVDVVCTD